MTADDVRRRKIAERLREIARDRGALRNALDRFAGADEFAITWASEDPDEINRRDQVERPYERIVNDLQEIVDLCETEASQRGHPVPEGAPGDEPGRWRRIAMRGYIAHAEAERWQGLAAARQRLQHHYADLRASRGAEIYERAEALLAELPRTVKGLRRWIEELWPP
jgi:hypothetical protein